MYVFRDTFVREGAARNGGRRSKRNSAKFNPQNSPKPEREQNLPFQPNKSINESILKSWGPGEKDPRWELDMTQEPISTEKQNFDDKNFEMKFENLKVTFKN